MATRIVVEHGGSEYVGQLAKIDSTQFGYESHGILTAYLSCSWIGGGVSIGGFCLDRPASRETSDWTRKGTSYGLDHLMRLMETVGVDSWEKLPGQQVIVLSEGAGGWGSRSVGIANALDEKKVFILAEHAQQWRDAAEADA